VAFFELDFCAVAMVNRAYMNGLQKNDGAASSKWLHRLG